MSRRLIYILPLLGLLVLGAFLYRGLFLNPHELPSALVGKALPDFVLPDLLQPDATLKTADLRGPALLNVWATWCPSCRQEHPFLQQLAQADVRIYGVDYKDVAADARQWLQALGNPYERVIDDTAGKLGLDLGVYGAPETFLIDAHGVIRERHAGVLDEALWQRWAPMYEAMKRE